MKRTSEWGVNWRKVKAGEFRRGEWVLFSGDGDAWVEIALVEREGPFVRVSWARELDRVRGDDYKILAECGRIDHHYRPTDGTYTVASSLAEIGVGDGPEDLRLHRCNPDESWIEFDAKGIPLCRVCDACRDAKLSKYRSEVLADPGYEFDDCPIEPEEEIR